MDILKINRETFKDAVQSLLHEDSSYIIMTENDGNLKLSSINTEKYAAGSATIKVDETYLYQPIKEMHITGKYMFDGFILSKFLSMSPFINSPDLTIEADANKLKFTNGNHSIKLVNVKGSRSTFNTDDLFSKSKCNIKVEVLRFKEYIDFIAKYSRTIIFTVIDNVLYLTSDDMQDDGSQNASVMFAVGNVECSNEKHQSKHNAQTVNWFISNLPHHIKYINICLDSDCPIGFEYTTNNDLSTVRYAIAHHVSYI